MVMIKVLIYGVMPENNFGCPSIMHGVEEVIKELHNEYEIISYQNTKPDELASSDLGFPIYKIPYNKTSDMLMDALKLKFGIQPKTEEKRVFFKNIRNSDVVANLFGICFCSSFNKGKFSYLGAIKYAICQFPISFIAKMFKIKSVKCTSSYGPITSDLDKICAKFSTKHIFDVMYAREVESKKQLEQVSGKVIPVSPDIANYMAYDIPAEKKQCIGISISYQIIRQWKSEESYINIMVNLIKHIISELGYKVILIPNEMIESYHDGHVAIEIHNQLNKTDAIEILDVVHINSTQLKSRIAECEAVIASRYHSCVAALSAGVPTLVVGWHYKYDELLHLYEQDKWIISSGNCSTKELIKLFDEFWDNREINRLKIRERYKDVKKLVLEAGKAMFTV
jgi:polysaccharide pyruvyl transferase WcaK-like protein